MPPAECPNCRQPAPRRLEAPGQEGAAACCYRCDECRHVWTVPANPLDADPGTSAQGPAPLDVYRVVIKCPNTGRAIPPGHELASLDGFADIGLQPEACRCPYCPSWHVWRHTDAWIERGASRASARGETGR